MPTSPVNLFSGRHLLPIKDPNKARRKNVNLRVSTTYPHGTLLGEIAGRREVQRLTGGTQTGGDFTLTFGANTTAAIAWNASAVAVAAALNLLASVIAVGGVSASGGALPVTPIDVTFLDTFNPAALTSDITGLTGGGEAVTVTTPTGGVIDQPGTYGAYASGNVDGTQTPTVVLEYDVKVDSSGNVFYGDDLSGEWRQSEKGAPAYVNGIFASEDLVGLDANAVTVMQGRIYRGDTTTGVFGF